MSVTIRPAVRGDEALVLRFVRELAAFQRQPDAVKADAAAIADALFNAAPAAEAVIAEVAGEPVGVAVFFGSFSTWTGRRGLYVEDLYVVPWARGTGIGTALLRHIAALAVARGCGQCEWTVLDWNAPAIALYAKIGAVGMDEWTVQRLGGEALHRFARG